MSVASAMKTALKTYLDDVHATLNTLEELEELANVHSTLIETNKQIHLNIEDSSREIAHLYGQLEELKQDYFNASFESNSERVAEIEQERDSIDTRISELEDGIETAREKITEVDGEAIAELLQRVDNAEVSVFFGPRIDGARFRLPTGAYRSTPASGLLAELQAGNDQLMAEINTAKVRIRGMQQWST